MVFSYFKERESRIKERMHQNKRIQFESLLLGIASPDQIRRWAQRKLPNGSVIGQVLTAKTLDYKTLKPLRGGLFCERIFGPTKDFYCACNKRQPKNDVRFCPDCEVEYYPATIRRHRLGYIELVSGSVHIWYFKGRPNYLSILLKMKRPCLERLIYGTSVLVNAHLLDLVPNIIRSNNLGVPQEQKYSPGHTIPVRSNFCCDVFRQRSFFNYVVSAPEPGDRTIPAYCSGALIKEVSAGIPKGVEEEVTDFQEMLRQIENERFAKKKQVLNAIGGQAVANVMKRLNLRKLCELLAVEIAALTPEIEWRAKLFIRMPTYQRELTRAVYRRRAHIHRLKLVDAFLRNKRKPEWMVLSVLPVLPPTIRPISMINGTIISSDLNRLYQVLIFRNYRLSKLSIVDTELIAFHQALVQRAVDALLENGKGGSEALLDRNNRPLKALADHLKGKRGRFRFNLLGKRVDYSGRSVIVVGPKMKLHECGLPREMALKLFTPFLMRRLIQTKYVDNFLRAKLYIRMQHPVIWPLLIEIMAQYPILLNRAPTLHRLGIQAFQPHLVSTQTILLHPLVCTAFNADFDGDQMAVHVPLTFAARTEAWKLLWSRNNLLAPATGDPILAPSQDMILGSYYLTTNGLPKIENRAQLGLPPIDETVRGVQSGESTPYFHNFEDVLQAFHHDLIQVRTPIWLRLPLEQTSQNGEKPAEPKELQIHADGFGFAVFTDVQQRRQWSISTDERDFLTAYAVITSQFVQTSAGRVLVNQLMTSPEPTMRSRSRQRIKSSLVKIFTKMREKSREAELESLGLLIAEEGFDIMPQIPFFEKLLEFDSSPLAGYLKPRPLKPRP